MGITYNKQITKKARLQPGTGPRDRQMRQKSMLESTPAGIDASLVEELRGQIRILQQQLEQRPSGENGFTADQVNEEITKAIKAELGVVQERHKAELAKITAERDDLKKKYKRSQKEKAETIKWSNETEEKLLDQERELITLREKLKLKEELVQQLRNTKAQEAILPEADLKEALAQAAKEIATQMSQGEILKSDRPRMEEVFVDPLEEGAGSGVDATNVKVEDVSISDKELMKAKVDKLKDIMGKLPMKRPV